MVNRLNTIRGFLLDRVNLNKKLVWYVAGVGDTLIVLVIILAVVKSVR